MQKFLLVSAFSLFFLILSGQSIETVVQKSSGGKSDDFSISSNGLLLAKLISGISSNDIEIWNTKTGHLVRSIRIDAKTIGLITTVRFWKDNKQVITGTSFGNHEIFDVATGKLVKRLPLASWIEGVFALNNATGTLVCLHPLSFSKSSFVFYDLYSETAFDSVNTNITGISAFEFSPDGQKLAIGTESGKLYVYNRNIDSAVFYGNSVKGRINYLQWTKDNYLLVSDSGMLKFYDLNRDKIIRIDSLENGSRIVAIPNEDGFYMSGISSIQRFSGEMAPQRSLGIQPDEIAQVQVNDEGNTLLIITENHLKRWDLRKMVSKNNWRKNETITNQSFLRLVPGKNEFIKAEKNTASVISFDSIFTSTNSTSFPGKVNDIYTDPFGNIFLHSENKIWEWRKENKAEIALGKSQKILFSTDGNTLATTAQKDSVIHFLNNDKKTTLVLSGEIRSGTVSNNNQYMAITGDKLFLVNKGTLQYKRLYQPLKEDIIIEYEGTRTQMSTGGNYRQVYFSKNDKKLFARDHFGAVKIWDVASGSLDTILNLGADQIYYSNDADRLFIISKNELIWINPLSYAREASMVFLASGDHIVTLPDNYYTSSRNGTRAIAFRKGIETSNFDQFDIIYNRPDIVAQRLVKPGAEEIELMENAVKKRIRRMGGDVNRIPGKDIDAPEVSIRNYASLPAITKTPLFKFEVNARDRKNNIVNCKGFINGIPFTSKYGYVISDSSRKTNSVSLNWTIFLDPGHNLIEITCINDKGIESARSSFEVFYETKEEVKPNLYFIGVGATTYRDASHNLKYPEKDIRDVARLFTGENKMYGKTKTFLFTNENVVRENILKIKSILDSTRVEDHVIIYWSGHGILNKELDYFLATWPMDFHSPAGHGMEYTALEDLLDDIPARKRLLFIDACHSGELDKEEVKFARNTETAPGSVSGNKTKGLEIDESVMPTTDILQEVFSDIRRSSGANVISAAGGAEYAFEGDTWNNGVFTYSLLMGLKEKKADLNNDGKILISELQSFLEKKVTELTGGKQKPTSRRENLVNDWRIW